MLDGGQLLLVYSAMVNVATCFLADLLAVLFVSIGAAAGAAGAVGGGGDLLLFCAGTASQPRKGSL